ncbi:hypothetical protein ACJX0J_036155, partial [Zea mays]
DTHSFGNLDVLFMLNVGVLHFNGAYEEALFSKPTLLAIEGIVGMDYWHEAIDRDVIHFLMLKTCVYMSAFLDKCSPTCNIFICHYLGHLLVTNKMQLLILLNSEYLLALVFKDHHGKNQLILCHMFRNICFLLLTTDGAFFYFKCISTLHIYNLNWVLALLKRLKYLDVTSEIRDEQEKIIKHHHIGYADVDESIGILGLCCSLMDDMIIAYNLACITCGWYAGWQYMSYHELLCINIVLIEDFVVFGSWKAG